ncbi:MAG: prepilin peptidase [Acidobacteriota bacterium]|nr:prepilin peptidase [Acidobacteriota bacterium]
MFPPVLIASAVLLVPLAVIITYYDVRYRRIPNKVVLATLISGLILNTIFDGLSGLLASLAGCALAFALMILLHVFGAMGAGDVKLFAAIGSVVGLHMVLPTFVVIVMTGCVFAVITMLRAGTVRVTMNRVLQILIGLLPGYQLQRYDVPVDRRFTIPYGVAITLGSLVSLAFFRT